MLQRQDRGLDLALAELERHLPAAKGHRSEPGAALQALWSNSWLEDVVGMLLFQPRVVRQRRGQVSGAIDHFSMVAGETSGALRPDLGRDDWSFLVVRGGDAFEHLERALKLGRTPPNVSSPFTRN